MRLHKEIFVTFVALVFTSAIAVSQTRNETDFTQLMADYGLVDVSHLDPGLTVDMRYSTTNNFVGKDMYGTFTTPYLTQATADALLDAVHRLQRVDSLYGIVIYDAARPLSVQRIMWNVVKGTPQEKYVARPNRGGPHNYGIAVDIGLTFAGEPLDMGTDFDNFTPSAHITDESTLVRQGKISAAAKRNRELLRRAMTLSGFQTYSREWWHFVRYDIKYARRHLKLLDF